MKIIRFVVISVSVVILSGCKQIPDGTTLMKRMENYLAAGNFAGIQILTDSIKKIYPGEKQLIIKADSLSQIAQRIAIDFSVPENIFISQLNESVGNFSAEELQSWENRNWLEWKMINGEKKYFRRAASNLRLIRNFNLERTYYDSLNSVEPEILLRKSNISSIIQTSDDQHNPALPVNMVINYSIIVKPDAVPEGEIIRCWLPYPKEDKIRQQNIKFISASHENYRIAPDSVTHRTIYMEAKSMRGVPLVFSVSYSYQSSGQYFDPDKIKILPYDRNSDLYKKYTAEQLPDICFTENIRHITDSITGSEEKPFEILKKIYYWIDENIPWAGSLEYSTMPNIPEYVLRNRRGDCGMQTFLLMSMLRYKGIPVRWQSGWMMPPENENLHDWCEVYFEGPGWIPVDMSYGLQYSCDRKIREFYISGIDSYRLIINDGVAGSLFPAKKFLRSEPLDFQRGEVEWSGGNVYFNKWEYNMKIEYLTKKRTPARKPELQLSE